MIGTSVDRYRIVEELGHGGMSVVYRGVDTSLHRDVAVKVLHNHLAKKADSRKRFHREAQAIARLRHPNILSIFDYSAENADRAYIVMEYVKGVNLRQFVAKNGAVPSEVAALIGIRLADALANAHDHGIIHRDLKPENIMVSTTGDLKLTDFGIAHVIDAETMTQTGSLLGSPAHMAPEIIEGERIDRRADIFSLGTVLYWLTTGKLPFDGANAPQVLKKVLTNDFEDPELVDPCIGNEMANVIKIAMANDPNDRFENARDIRAALEVIVEAGGITEEVELSKFLVNPDKYMEGFEKRCISNLTLRAKNAVAEHRLPEAMSLFNRILAYQPDNTMVRQQLEAIGRRAAFPRIAGVTVALIAVIFAGIAIFTSSDEGPSDEDARDDALLSALADAGSSAADRILARVEEDAQNRAKAATRGGFLATYVSEQALVLATSPPYLRALEAKPRPKLLIMPSKDMGTQDQAAEEVASHTYAFRVLPLAAMINVGGKTYTAFQAAKGISLPAGRHNLTATSRACKPWRGTIVVDGPQTKPQDVVLMWEAGVVKISSNVAAVIYEGTSQNVARTIPARGSVTFRYGFGNARQKNTKPVSFRIAPASDMTKIQQRRVQISPGSVQNLTLNF